MYHQGHPPCPGWGRGRIGPVLHSIRTDVSALPSSRLRRSPLHGETRRRSALSAASNAQITCCRMTPSCRLVSSATVFAIASITSSASAVSTLSEPACPIPQSWSQEPVHVGGGGRNYSRAGETVARSAPGAHAAARSCFSVSAADTFTSVHRFKGSIPQ